MGRKRKAGKKKGAAAKKVGKGRYFAETVKRFRATIALTLLVLVSYLLLSGSSLFIERQLLYSLSFSLAKPLNIFSYLFLHLSPWHLAVNLVSLVLFAAIVENRLGWKHVIGIFVFSAVLTAAVFSLVNPHADLAGASAGIWGLMASAFVLDLRKTVLAIAAGAAVIVLLFSGIGFAVNQKGNSLMRENLEIEASLRQAVESGQEERAEALTEEKASSEQRLQSFYVSYKSASNAEVDLFLHSYAGILGIAYILLFRRRETENAVKEQWRFASG